MTESHRKVRDWLAERAVLPPLAQYAPDVFLEALDVYRKRPGACMQTILEYVRVNRVESKIQPYVEAKA